MGRGSWVVYAGHGSKTWWVTWIMGHKRWPIIISAFYRSLRLTPPLKAQQLVRSWCWFERILRRQGLMTDPVQKTPLHWSLYNKRTRIIRILPL